jgi:hypothetical protein
VALLLIGVHSFVFRGDGSYADNVHLSFQAIGQNLKGYFWELHNSLWPFYGRPTAWLFTFVLLGLGIAGYISRARSGISVLEVFAATYTGAILLWTAEFDTRFLIPVLPLWLYYVISYVRLIAAKHLALNARLAPLLLLPLFIASYASAYTGKDFGPIRQGVGDPRFLQACAYIKTHTAPGAVIVFAKPRLLALMTDRRAAAYHQPATDSELRSYFSNISAEYILFSTELTSDVVYMRGFIERQGPKVNLLFDNGAFALYRIQ